MKIIGELLFESYLGAASSLIIVDLFARGDRACPLAVLGKLLQDNSCDGFFNGVFSVRKKLYGIILDFLGIFSCFFHQRLRNYCPY